MIHNPESNPNWRLEYAKNEEERRAEAALARAMELEAELRRRSEEILKLQNALTGEMDATHR